MIDPTINSYTGASDGRAHGAELSCYVTRQNPYFPEPHVKSSIASNGVDKLLELSFYLVNYIYYFGVLLCGDIPSHSANQVHTVCLSISGNKLTKPHHRLPDSPGLHQQGLKSDDVSSDAQPKQVAMYSLQL
jgi:hypothetical protein